MAPHGAAWNPVSLRASQEGFGIVRRRLDSVQSLTMQLTMEEVPVY